MEHVLGYMIHQSLTKESKMDMTNEQSIKVLNAAVSDIKSSTECLLAAARAGSLDGVEYFCERITAAALVIQSLELK